MGVVSFLLPTCFGMKGTWPAGQAVSGVAWCVWRVRFEPALNGVSPRERDQHLGSCWQSLTASSWEVPWAGCDLGSCPFLELKGDCRSSVI